MAEKFWSSCEQFIRVLILLSRLHSSWLFWLQTWCTGPRDLPAELADIKRMLMDLEAAIPDAVRKTFEFLSFQCSTDIVHTFFLTPFFLSMCLSSWRFRHIFLLYLFTSAIYQSISDISVSLTFQAVSFCFCYPDAARVLLFVRHAYASKTWSIRLLSRRCLSILHVFFLLEMWICG